MWYPFVSLLLLLLFQWPKIELIAWGWGNENNKIDTECFHQLRSPFSIYDPKIFEPFSWFAFWFSCRASHLSTRYSVIQHILSLSHSLPLCLIWQPSVSQSEFLLKRMLPVSGVSPWRWNYIDSAEQIVVVLLFSFYYPSDCERGLTLVVNVLSHSLPIPSCP